MPSPPVPDQNRGPGFLAEVVITTVAALVTVALRFYVRTHVVRALGWDDWIILLSMVIIEEAVGYIVTSAADLALRFSPSLR